MFIDNGERRLSVTLARIWDVDGCWGDTRLGNTIDFPVIKIGYHKGKKISNISIVSYVTSHMVRLQPRQSAAVFPWPVSQAKANISFRTHAVCGDAESLGSKASRPEDKCRWSLGSVLYCGKVLRS